jgi:glucosyl-3-phosphoglycerate synthase
VTAVPPALARSQADAPTSGVARFEQREIDPVKLAVEKRARAATIHVLIPARDEARTIGAIVGAIRRDLMEATQLVDDLAVVDDASRDATAREAAAEGARVLEGPGQGKGEAMRRALDGLPLTRDTIVVWLDGDVTNFGPRWVTSLAAPLLRHQTIDLVKARYRRPIGEMESGGGRVTELTAKPALGLLFPELAPIDQPLAGETAVRGSLLHEIELESGYAVEVALLIDAYKARGLAAIAEVDLGERRHRNRPLQELVPQARTVLAAVLQRAQIDPSGGIAW